MMSKTMLASLALVTAPGVLWAGGAGDAGAAPVSQAPTMPEVYAVDAAGHPLNDVVFGGEVDTRPGNDLDWNGENLSDYGWTRMYGHSNTGYVVAGPQSATQEGGFNSSIPDEDTTATSCADATMTITIDQLAAPAGYVPAKGSLTVCQTVNGWVEGSNTTGGGITFTSAPANQVPHITIHDAKGSGPDGSAAIPSQSKGAILPNVAKVKARAIEYGVPGMEWNGKLSYDSDDDGTRDTTTSISTAEGLSTDLSMGQYSYSDEMETTIAWHGLNSSKATSCANSPAVLTLWETKAPTGYQKVDKPATLCLIGGQWVQTMAPNDSTGWIKFDSHDNLIRFGEYPALPVRKPGTNPSKPIKPGKPAETVIPVVPVKKPAGGGQTPSVPANGTPGTSGSTPAAKPAIGPKVQTDDVRHGSSGLSAEVGAALLVLAGAASVRVVRGRTQ